MTTYPVPAASGQTEVVSAANKIWFTQFSANAIGSIDPSNPGAGVTLYGQGNAGLPLGITLGSDGDVWFTEVVKGALGKLDPNNTAGGIQSFTLPGKNYVPVNNSSAKFLFNSNPSDVVTGPDGALWYTDPANSAIGRLDPANPNGAVAYLVNSSTANISIGINILSSQIVSAAGRLWFTEASFGGDGSVTSSGVGIFNPTTNQFSEVVFPNAAGKRPLDIAVGSDGNIWVSVADTTTNGSTRVVNSSDLVRIDVTHGNAVTEFPLTAPANASLPYAYRIASGPDGNIWFSDTQNGQIGVFNITAHTTSYRQLPTAGAQPDGLMTGPDGNIWYSDSTGVLGRIIEATRLTVHDQPVASMNSGTPFGFSVYATTAAGTLDTSFNGSVTVSLGSNPGGASLGGTKTVTAVNGVATFSGLTLDKAGNGYTLTVSTSGLTSATTNAVNVSSAVQGATHVVVQAQPPATLKAGTPFTVVVRAVNDSGAVDTTYSGNMTITLANNPGGSTLGGTTVVTAVQGVATFSGLSLNNAANGYTLTIAGNGLASATTSGINVTQPATHLVIVTPPPSSPTTGAPFTVVVRAVNDSGAVDTTYSGNVTIGLANGASGLMGTTTVQAVNGEATFTNLTLGNAGNGYSLVVSSGSLTVASSAAINVQAPPSPVVTLASIVMNPPKSKRGKATFGGFQIQFSSPMDGGSLGNGNNYALKAMVQVTQKVGKKKVRVTLPIKDVPFSLQVVNSTTVRLLTTNQKIFKLGGQINLVGTAPGGIKSAAGGYLGGVTGSVVPLSISKNAKSVS